MSEVNESNATDGNVTDEGQNEDIELLEEKLNSKAVGSILARKSGPGRTWPSETNSYCGVLSCSSTTASCKDLWFFKLPIHSYDNDRRGKWLEQIKRPDVQPYHRLLVCERHFDIKDIGGCKIGNITRDTKKYLKKGVIPTLHLPTESKTIQKNLHETQPKHVYKRVYQEVNKTTGYDEPSTSGKEKKHAIKKSKTQETDLETTITDNTVKIKTNTLRKKVSTDKAEQGLSLGPIENEPSPTKLKPEEYKEHANERLETFIKLKHKFKDEPFDYNKYTDECQNLIRDMYHANPQYYEVLQDMSCLPPISALKSFRQSLEGLNRKCMQSLAAKLSLLSPIQKYVTFCIDIVKMMPNVYYDYELDIINGVNRQATPYRYAIIAMVQGMTTDWHQILSVYLIDDITFANTLRYRTWVDDLTLSVSRIGMCVIAVITSTHDFFIQAYNIRETSIQSLSTKRFNYLPHGKQVWHIFNPLHLLWYLYKEFQDNSFVFNGKCTADWKYVEEFYLHDKEREAHFVDGPCKIPPGSSHQQKLKSAAAILLNRATAAGILAFVDMEILSEEARHTGKFLMILCEMFKFLYPTTIARPSHDQKNPVKKSKRILENFKRVKKFTVGKKLMFFKKFKTCPKSNDNINHDVAKCFVSSFRSILDIIDDTKILELPPFSDVSELMKVLNMNPLIEFIDTIKLKYTKPLTSEILIEIINKSLIQNSQPNMKAFMENANRLIELEEFYRVPNLSMVMKDHKSYISDYCAFSDNDGNSLMYVATYLLDKMYQQFRNVVSTRMRLLNSSVHYQNQGANFSGTIIIPDDEFLDLVIKMDTVVINNWKKAMLSGTVFATLKEKMSKAIADVRYSGDAATLDFIEDLFIHMRIYNVLKYNKDRFEEDQDTHEFDVKRLEGYTLDYKKVLLECLDCFRV